jgi:hypothetical protein
MSDRHAISGSWSRARRGLVWGFPFALLAVALGAWDLASPIGSATDEPTGIVHAIALVRGQLIGSAAPHNIANAKVFTVVRVPATFARIYHSCFAFRPTQSAACVAHPVVVTKGTATAQTLVGHYPPLYYAVVGLASFLSGGDRVIYAMRMSGALVNAAFLALAIFALVQWSRRSVMVVGFVFGLTPMVFYYASVVNPSGLELSTSVCGWTLAAIWAVEYGEHPPPGLVAAMVVTTSVLVLARPASLAWPAMMAVVLAPMVWRRASWWAGVAWLRTAWRRPRALWGTGILVACVIFALAWVLFAHPFLEVGGNYPAPGTPLTSLVHRATDEMPGFLQQSVGVFGWLDTALPSAVAIVWYVAVGGLLLGGLLFGTARGRLAILGTMLLSYLVPVAGTVSGAHTRGFTSQGRYFLPLFIGLPVVAAAVIGDGWTRRTKGPSVRVARLLVVGSAGVACGLQIVAFGTAMRRFTVGTNGPIWPTGSGRGTWAPPLPALALDIVAAATLVVLYAILAWGHSSAVDGVPSPSCRP